MNSNELESLKTEGDLNLSAARREWADQHIDTATQELLDQDAEYFLHQSLSSPCLNVLSGCEGSYLTDTQGRRLLDFHGNNVHQVGFGNPHVIQAITEQMQQLSFCTRRYTNKPAIDLAKKLSELAPGEKHRILLAPGGTSAIGIALKLARAATGRHKTISLWDSFHGASLDAISLGGEAIFRKHAGPLLPGSEHVPPPDPNQCPFRCGESCSLQCADYIEYVLEKEGDVAAVVAETVRSTPFIPPLDYWKKIRNACDRHGALLILDEIPHCLGRTGKMFTCEHYDVEPDMLVIGKGLGGGVFPLAAVIARDELNVAAAKALGHYTHEKNPVACAAALATIKLIEEHDLLVHATTMGQQVRDRINGLATKNPIIQEFRGLGLLMGVRVGFGQGDKVSDNALAEDIMYRCLSQGLNFKLTLGSTLTLTPPLTISKAEMEQALDILESAMQEAREAKSGG